MSFITIRINICTLTKCLARINSPTKGHLWLEWLCIFFIHKDSCLCIFLWIVCKLRNFQITMQLGSRCPLIRLPPNTAPWRKAGGANAQVWLPSPYPPVPGQTLWPSAATKEPQGNSFLFTWSPAPQLQKWPQVSPGAATSSYNAIRGSTNTAFLKTYTSNNDYAVKRTCQFTYLLCKGFCFLPQIFLQFQVYL